MFGLYCSILLKLDCVDFSLDQLQVLDTIVQTGSYRAAGARLGRATSAVSYAVTNLEQALGFPLFARRGRRSVLTPAGSSVLHEARALLERANSFSAHVAGLRDEWEPTLGVVVDGILPVAPFMMMAGALRQHGAPTMLNFQREYLSGVRTRFDRDELDLMVSLDFAGDAAHIASPLPQLKLWLVAEPTHPLAGKRSQRSDLSDQIEVVVHDSARNEPSEDARLSLGCGRVLRLSDFASKLAALKQGLGIGWMPEHLCQPALEDGTLVRLRVVGAQQHVFVPHLVYRRRAPLGRAAALISEQITVLTGWTQ